MAENYVNIRVELQEDGTPVVTYDGQLSTAEPDDRIMMQLIGYGLFGMLEDDHMEVCQYGMKTIARMKADGTFESSFMEVDDEPAEATHEGVMRVQ